MFRQKLETATLRTIGPSSGSLRRISSSFRLPAGVLAQRLKEAYQTLDGEFAAVGNIQRSLLPAELPRVPTLDLAAFYQPSRRAGGDYYDFFPLPDGKWGVWIADVSGHGTPAAVLMAVTHTIAHTHPGPPTPPGRLLAYVNNHLTRRYTSDGSFVTAV